MAEKAFVTDQVEAKAPIGVNIARFRELGLLGFIVLLCLFIQLQNPSFLTPGNMESVLKNTSILAILAMGMMLVIVTRGIDLSIGATLALSGMIAAQTVSTYPHLNPFIALLLGTGIGLICGSILGLLVSKGGILPIIATLGMMNVYRGLTFTVSDGSWVSAHQMPDSFKHIAAGSILGLNHLVLFAVVIMVGAYYFINHTRTGIQIYAVGSNPESARISGINKDRILFLVYSLMGSLAGLSGVLWVSRFASAQNDTAMGYELTVIAACVLGGVSIAGGVGKLSGVILGALLLGILNNALPLIGVSPFWQTAIQGAIILIAILVNVLVRRGIERNNLLRRPI
ncbi:ABC transporter permease [Caldalkalibacillus salinus]|uniref:ABC transporter permease n=1 Tax=Caldalkalibacillus salinus TaxID=2803787 RepID=UPI001921FF3F|nr:ABC transporter permease [Caldalkalibacillus salinus]